MTAQPVDLPRRRVEITVGGEAVRGLEGDTILDVLRARGADPPTLCHAETSPRSTRAGFAWWRWRGRGCWCRRAPVGSRTEAHSITRTVCRYCGVGCNLDLWVQDNEIVKVTSPLDHSVTNGHLCMKGRFGFRHVQNR